MLVIKLGGSVLMNSLTEFNPKFFQFLDWLKNYKGQCIVTLGGGKGFRLYAGKMREMDCEETNIHLVGVRTNLMNAEFIRSLLPKSKTYPTVIQSEADIKIALMNKEFYQFFSCGAWGPGRTSDYNASAVAEGFGVERILRISNIDFLYDSDPNINSEAKIVKRTDWDGYLNIIGNPTGTVAGGNYPVDPIASKYSKEHGIKFMLTSLDRFIEEYHEKGNELLLDDEKFIGSVIG